VSDSARVHVDILEAFGEERALAAVRETASPSAWSLGGDRMALYLDPGAGSDGVRDRLERASGVYLSDQSDAWSTWLLGGDDAAALLARHVETPVATESGTIVQAPFAHVEARMIRLVDGVVLSVAASHAHHVDDALASCLVVAPWAIPWRQLEEAIRRDA
jgi:hypothetical protein